MERGIKADTHTHTPPLSLWQQLPRKSCPPGKPGLHVSLLFEKVGRPALLAPFQSFSCLCQMFRGVIGFVAKAAPASGLL